uniref:Uncharacterized protein n=1 Tax=Anguilla anguilla TaxID=7936 RepID=A0A0E9W4U0_ANGAN
MWCMSPLNTGYVLFPTAQHCSTGPCMVKVMKVLSVIK